jgi:uncharacterized membrane protein
VSVPEEYCQPISMKRTIYFYGAIACLTVINALLLSSPNLLGKIGLFVYKYNYLRTFPKTLLTVFIAVVIAICIAEFIGLLVKNRKVKRNFGIVLLLIFVALLATALYKTMIDFSAFTYAHTGHRFRYGAYLLPCLLMLIFGYKIFNLHVKVEGEIPVENKPL